MFESEKRINEYIIIEPPNNDMPKLINFLRANGYQLQEEVQYNPDRGASARAIFTKYANIVELDGNGVNDATITPFLI